MRPAMLLRCARPLVLCALLVAPLRAQGSAAVDTLPRNVIQRLVDAFKRKDIDGTFADYDSVFYHVSAGDTLVERATRIDWLKRLKVDSMLPTFFRDVDVADVSIDIRGSWARLVWTFRESHPKGSQRPRTWKMLNALQVKRGKIVYEIEA